MGGHDLLGLAPCSHPTSRPCRCKRSRASVTLAFNQTYARRVALLAPVSLLAPPSFAATSTAQDVLKDLAADAIPAPGTSWALLNRTREVKVCSCALARITVLKCNKQCCTAGHHEWPASAGDSKIHLP